MTPWSPKEKESISVHRENSGIRASSVTRLSGGSLPAVGTVRQSGLDGGKGSLGGGEENSFTLVSLAENKIFLYALLISFFAHIVFFVKLSINAPKLPKSPIKRIEISYRPVRSINQKQSQSERTASSRPQPTAKKISQTTKILQDNRMIPSAKTFLNNQPKLSSLTKDSEPNINRFQIEKKQPSRVDIHSVERRITVPELKSEKINNPVYLSYYQIVRNRIKDKAYLNYSRTDSGSIYLTFVLTNGGVLKQVKLIEEKSSANDYLRSVGLRSVQESNPFPSFPSDLKYPELSFNVVISFEVKD